MILRNDHTTQTDSDGEPLVPAFFLGRDDIDPHKAERFITYADIQRVESEQGI